MRNATVKEAKDALTKAAAMMRLHRAEAALYRAVEAVADARRELSPIVGGGINVNCERLAGLDARIKREIHDLSRRRDAGQCDLDETMKAVLQREAEGNRRATKKGVR